MSCENSKSATPNTWPPRGARVAVGMSGGVDSSMAAWLLKRAGYDVFGVTMAVWDGSIPLPDSGRSGCFGPGEGRDIKRARAVAERLGIPHYVVPLAPDYRAEVLEYVRQEYLAGRTPNPCAICNRRIKLDRLPACLRDMGVPFDYFATGHYARLQEDIGSGRRVLLRGADRQKDQSYFLALLDQSQLRQLVLPLGEYTKQQVRAWAREAGFDDLADLDESQDFIETGGYTALFGAADFRPGDIIDTRGRVLGRHAGLPRYTIGQRKGLGIGGVGEPLYVVAIDAERNRLVVGRREELLRSRMWVRSENWVARTEAPRDWTAVEVQIRYRQAPIAARIRKSDEGAFVEVEFDVPQAAVTPGQVAVFYDGDVVIGAGRIEGSDFRCASGVPP